MTGKSERNKTDQNEIRVSGQQKHTPRTFFAISALDYPTTSLVSHNIPTIHKHIENPQSFREKNHPSKLLLISQHNDNASDNQQIR